jgi:hypothetical protein
MGIERNHEATLAVVLPFRPPFGTKLVLIGPGKAHDLRVAYDARGVLEKPLKLPRGARRA